MDIVNETSEVFSSDVKTEKSVLLFSGGTEYLEATPCSIKANSCLCDIEK